MELDKKQFELIKPLKWSEVFKIWQGNEINQRHWKTYYKEKGFKSWFDWRKKHIKAIEALNKKWKLVKVINPLKSVPKFHGGPYKSWTENFYKGHNLPTFNKIKEHWAAADYLKNLPAKTTIIVWNTEIGIVIIEGMHRCAAITKAAKEKQDIKLDLYMVVADCPLSDIPDFRKTKEFTKEEAKKIGDKINIDWSKYDLEQFRMGLGVELEHGLHDAETNVTNDDEIMTGKIALAHLKEISDYYTRLDAMEKEAEK